MGEALLGRRLAAAGAPAIARSGGTHVVEATPVEPHARRVVPGLDEHRSRPVTVDMLISADLVLAVCNEQVSEIIDIEPAAGGWTFALSEFVALATDEGARFTDESFDTWVARVGSRRSKHDLESALPTVSSDVTVDRSGDIADPIGQMLTVYQQTAATLDELLLRLVDLAWPPATRSAPDSPALSRKRWRRPRAGRDSPPSAPATSKRRRFRRS